MFENGSGTWPKDALAQWRDPDNQWETEEVCCIMGGSEPERAQCESGRLFFMCEPAYGNLPLTQRAASRGRKNLPCSLRAVRRKRKIVWRMRSAQTHFCAWAIMKKIYLYAWSGINLSLVLLLLINIIYRKIMNKLWTQCEVTVNYYNHFLIRDTNLYNIYNICKIYP